MSKEFGIKVEEIFNTMEERFRPDGAEGVDDSYGYDIKGRGKWKLTVKDAKMKIGQVDDLSGCVAVSITDPDTFVGINIGKVDPMQAFNSGKFTVDGDLGALGKTAKMFKKFVVPVKEMSTRDYVQDMFGSLVSRFQPSGAEGLDVTIGYDISGPDGGQWMAVIKDGKCELRDKIEGKPTVQLELADTDWVELMTGKVDAMSLLSAGKAAMVGETQLALKLGDIFAKYVDPMAGGEPEQELIVHKTVISVEQRFATGPIMGKFLKGLKNKKILANKCPKCERMHVPPREVCADCRVRNEMPVEVGPNGDLRMMEFVYYASPDPLTGETRETPYYGISILLDGTRGNETFWGLLRSDQIDRVKMGKDEKKGTRLRPAWAEERTGSILDIKYFEIDE